jgi:ketol-acid reductoisomerase
MIFAKNKERIDSNETIHQPACVGLMVVKRFEDGGGAFRIMGYYKDRRDSAVDSAIELAAYARNRCLRIGIFLGLNNIK